MRRLGTSRARPGFAPLSLSGERDQRYLLRLSDDSVLIIENSASS